LAIPVLVVLALLWAAFFLWPLLSNRTSQRRVDSIGDFTHKLGVIGKTGGHRLRRRPAPAPIPVAMPRTRAVAPVGPRSSMISAHYAAVAGLPRSGGMTRAQRRRRDVLLVLGVGVLSSLMLAVFAGNTLFWFVQLLTDALLAAYVALLVRMKRAAEERRAKVHYLPGPAPAPALVLRRSSASS
jgi:hypothetical protein